MMDKFFQTFSVKKIKLGTIINLLDTLKMSKSKDKMVNVMKLIKELMDNRPCVRPEQMTDDELRAGLIERGMVANGSREMLVQKYKQSDNKCPLMKLSLPKNMYCRFDDLCMGVECCVDLKMLIFRKALKAYARLDPCNYTISVGVAGWNAQVPLLDIDWGIDVERTVLSIGELLDGIDIKVRYKVSKTDAQILFSLGLGVCSQKGEKKCMGFVDVLKDFMLPLPMCFPNGTIAKWPAVNVSDYLNYMKKELRNSGRNIAESAVKIAVGEVFNIFGIPKELLQTSGLCPRPDKMTVTQLKKGLAERGQSVTGAKHDLVMRYDIAERTCKMLRLPAVPKALSKYAYCSISQDCMRTECCLSLEIKRLKLSFTFRLWLELDPCEYVFNMGLNGYTKKIVIFNFPWGEDQEFSMGVFKIKYNIVRLLEEKVFVMTVGIAVCGIDGSPDCILDIPILKNEKVPIPFCNENFTLALPGGSVKGFLSLVGKNAAPGAVDAMIRFMGLQDVFEDGPCVPPTALLDPRSGCKKWSLPKLPSAVKCSIDDTCMGINCCIDLDLWITRKSVRAFASFDTCDYVISLGLGRWKANITLFTYAWGTEQIEHIGNAKEGNGITIRYAVDKLDLSKSFGINLAIDVCRDGDCSLSIPLLQDTVIPQPFCNDNFSLALPGGSVKDFLKTMGKVATDQAINAVLRHLGIHDLFTGVPCERPPVTIHGWDVSCPRIPGGLPTLPKQMSCSINDLCMGIQCCMDLDLGFQNWHPSVNAWVVLDPCDYKFSVGLEKWSFNTTLFHYEWGKWEEWTIGSGVIKFRFRIEKLSASKMFQVSLKLSVCIDGECNFNINVLNNNQVPQLLCNQNATFALPGGTLKNFMKDLGGQIGQEAIEAGMRHLGLYDLIESAPCDNSSVGPNCPHLLLPRRLPLGVQCRISPLCTGVECCVDVDLKIIRRSFRAWAILDACDYKLSVGFEKWNFNVTLFTYEWGKQEVLSVGNAIDIKFRINKLNDLKVFRMELAFGLAIDGDAGQDIVILQDYDIPIPLCNVNMSFSLPGGSIDEFTKSLGGQVTDMAVNAVIRHLGLESILGRGHGACQVPASGGCRSLQLPTGLPKLVSCSIKDNCFGVECCVTLDLKIIKRAFKAWVILDPCDYVFSVGFENWSYNKTLLDYNWGSWSTKTLGPALSLQFRLSKDSDRRMFHLDLNVHLESEADDISTQLEIFKDYQVPQFLCNTNDTFTLPDFSQIGDNLADSAIGILLQRLGLSPDFFKQEPCVHPTAVAPVTHGRCPRFQLPSGLPSNLHCAVTDTCLGMECCMDFKLVTLRHTFKAWFILDPCNFKVSIGFENWSWNKTLFDNWGDYHEQGIGSSGIFRLIFKFDKTAQHDLLVYLALRLCVDGSCDADIVVLDNAAVPIPLCSNGNLTWPKLNWGSIGDQAFQAATGIILNRLGLSADLLKSQPCIPANNTALQPTGQQQSACPLFRLPKLPENVHCTLESHCLGIQCCVDVDFKLVQRAFRAWIIVDPCTFDFSIGFENWHMNRSLISFDWGKEQRISIAKALVIKYTLAQSTDQKNFLVSLGLEICVAGSCDLDVYIMKDAVMPIPFCNINGTLSWPQIDWQGIGVDLAGGLISTLLGIDPRFLRGEPCLPNKTLEIQNATRCPYFKIPTLPSIVQCRLSDMCMGIECCINLDLKVASRSFKAWVLMDPFTFDFSIGFENWHLNLSLIGFDFGKPQLMELGKVLKFRYTIDKSFDLMNFILDMSLDVCLADGCIPTNILQGASIPIPSISNGKIVWPSIDWKDIGGQLTGGISGLIANRLGLDPRFLRSSQCGKLINVTGCPRINMPFLLPNVRCQVADTCVGIECCLDLDLVIVSRSFKMWAIIDPCQFRVSIGFENWSFNVSLLEYHWGQIMEDKIGSAVTVQYSIDKTADQMSFIFDVTLKLCFPGDSCLADIPLRTVVPIPFCNPDGSLTWPNVNMSTIGLDLWKQAVQSVLLELGLGPNFLESTECSLSDSALMPLSHKNCPLLQLPKNMPSNLQCSISSSCLSVRCCLQLKLLSLTRSFNAWIAVDPCNFKFTVGFEKWQMERTLFDQWGQYREEQIGNAIKILYKFDKSPDHQLLITLGVRICINDVCDIEIPLLSNAAVPIPGCSNGTFVWPKLDATGIIQSVQDASLALVLNRLGISPGLLRSPQCSANQSSNIIRPSHCPLFQLPALPSSVQCSLTDRCLGIDCCVDVDFKLLRRKFKAWIMLDPCTFDFSVGFENIFYNRTLLQYDWGVEKIEKIGRALTVRYKIDKSTDLRNFIITVGLQICIGSYCDIDIYIMKDQPVPIPMCNMNGTLSWPSLDWQGIGNQVAGGISGLVLTRLGLDPRFLNGQECQSHVPRENSTCPHFKLPAMPANVHCTLSEKCTGIECCIDLDLKVASQSFKAWILLDPCTFDFSIGFEKWSLNTTLIDYKFGEEKVESIGSALRLKYVVAKSPDQMNFMISLAAMLCLDGGCGPEITILTDATMPIPGCNPDGSFSWPSIDWDQVGGSAVGAISGLIMNRLGLDANFLRPSQCISPGNGSLSTNTCPHIDFPKMPSAIRCSVHSMCMGVECCIDLDLKITSHSFRFWAIIDPCIFMLSFGFEKWSYNISLLSYDWGRPKVENIGKALRLHYTVDRTADAKNFRVDLAVELCLDGDTCTNLPVMRNQLLPIPFCHPNGTLSFDFKGLGQDLLDSATAIVLNRLGLPQNFLRADACTAGNSTTLQSHKNCPNFQLPKLPSFVRCHIADNCLSVECCLDLKLLTLQRTFRAALHINPCDLGVSLSFENWYYNMTLIDHWGKEYEEDIGNALKVIFKYGSSVDGQMTTSIGVKVCDGVSCSDPITLLDGASIPIPFCGNGSFVWPQLSTGSVMDVAIGLILNRLGISPEVLKSDTCTSFPSAAISRAQNCPNVTLPTLPGGVTCMLSERCLGIECCADVDFKLVQRSFKTWVILDPCTYDFSIGFENWYYNRSLVQYAWGTPQVLHIGSALQLRLTIDRTSNLQYFNVSLDLQLCQDQVCDLSLEVIKQLLLPIPFCSRDGHISWPSLDIHDTVDKTLGKVMGLVPTRLGLEPGFFNNEECSYHGNGSEVTVCPHLTLPRLPSNIHCHLSDKCTGIECCINMDLKIVSRTFKTWLLLDPCTFDFSFGFEKWSFNRSLLRFPLGQQMEEHLGSALKLKYCVDKTEDLKDFVIDLAVELCLDGQCAPDFVLLQKQHMPIPGCQHQNGSLAWPSLNLTGATHGLFEGVSGLLVNRLGILPQFLESNQCQTKALPITDRGACPYFQLPHLPNNVHCTIHEKCLGIQCCLDLDLNIVSRSFHTWAYIDPCTFEVSLGFEKWSLNTTLTTYKWGTQHYRDIGRAIRLWYKFEKTPNNMYFVLSLGFQLCLDPNLPCTEDIHILQNTHVPIPVCGINGSLQWPDFSNIGSADQTLDTASSLVLSRLGLSPQLVYQGHCDIDYQQKTKSNFQCPHLRLLEVPGKVDCVFSDSCTGIECCLNLDLALVQHTFKTWLRLDPCTFEFSLGFEKWSFNTTLLSYDFGVEHTEYIGQALQLKYMIDKSVDNRDFLLTLKAVLCLDGACTPDIPVFRQMTLPVPVCSSGGSFQWLDINFANPAEKIIQVASGLVINRLGVTDLLRATPCVKVSDWSVNTCSHVVLPTLPPGVNCSMNPSCTGVDCCIELDLQITKRSFKSWALLDPCNFQMSVGFENWETNVSLVGYTWGTVQKKSIGKYLTFRYKVDKDFSGGNFIMDLSASLCFDGSQLCDYQINILNKTILPIPVCGENETYVWNENVTYNTLLVNRLRISQDLIRPNECQIQEIEDFATNETCTHGFTYHDADENDTVECRTQDNCSQVKCCVGMDLAVVFRSFPVSFQIDPCNDTYSITFENWQRSGSLRSFKFLSPSEYKMGKMLAVMYSIIPKPKGINLEDLLGSAANARMKRSDIPHVTNFPGQGGAVGNMFNGTFEVESFLVYVSLGIKSYDESVGDKFVDVLPRTLYTVPANCSLALAWSIFLPPDDILHNHIRRKRQVNSHSIQKRQALTAFDEERAQAHHALDELNSNGQAWVSNLIDKVKHDELPFDDLQKKLFTEMDKVTENGHDMVDQAANWGAEMTKNVVDESHLNFEEQEPNMRSDGLASFSQRRRSMIKKGQVSVDFGNLLNLKSNVKGLAVGGKNLVQKYIIGVGMSKAATEALGETLANMRIGDIQAYLDVRNLDPVTTLQLIKEMAELMGVIIEELIDVGLNQLLKNEFQSFDITLKGRFEYPRQVEVFFTKRKYFMVGGLIPMTLGFGAEGFWGVTLDVQFKILSFKVIGTVTPYVGSTVWGELGICILVCGKLRLEGDIMVTKFPTTAEVGFGKFPLDVGLKMDLDLVPLTLRLIALVTLDLPFVGSKTLFSANLWEFTVIRIYKNIFDVHTKEKDNSPPVITEYTTKKKLHRRGSRSVVPPSQTGGCNVFQVPDRDYTEPAFQLEVSAEDSESKVDLFYSVGKVPGGTDEVDMKGWSGPSAILSESLSNGVPLYFTVTAMNNQGDSSTATCQIPTYDTTLPLGRVTPEFTSTSHPSILRGSALALDDSPLLAQYEGVGFGRSIHGDQLVPWHQVQATKKPPVHSGMDPLNHAIMKSFTAPRAGRLAVTPFKVTSFEFPNQCAHACLVFPVSKCIAFNYEYTAETCELLEEIEGRGRELHHQGSFNYFERLGVGHTIEFKHENLQLQHHQLYYFNFKVDNMLHYSSIISSEGMLADFTPPHPGFVNVTTSRTVWNQCTSFTPSEWHRRCKDVTPLPNHHTIVDGLNSKTVFNGHEALVDLRWTRSNNYVSANWDGFHDNETGIFGYTWSIGRFPCDDMIHEHHDPHAHLFDSSEWTFSGTVHPLPPPYTILPDGRYFISVRALNKVELGGPMALTVCHTVPYIVDTSPPFMFEVSDVDYDGVTITTRYNATDPESDIKSVDIGLGRSRRDLDIQTWASPDYEKDSFLHFKFKVPDGTPTWVKVRGSNNVDLRAVKTADKPIVVDNTPPVAGQVYDGWIHGKNMTFSGLKYKLCMNWENFHDPESGIISYSIGFGTCHGCTNVVALLEVSGYEHEYCAEFETELQHNQKYYGTVTAVNGGYAQLNVTVHSPGVLVDLTKAVEGQIVDGVDPRFKDMKFSAKKGTVSAQWKNYDDPESGIRDYQVTVMRKHWDANEFQVVHPMESVGNNVEQIAWHHFHMHHADTVKTILNTTNGALSSITSTTDTYIVDLTPPSLGHLYDGLDAGYDRLFQSDTTKLSCNWKFSDPESGIDHYRIKIFEMKEGTKTQIKPENHGSWETLPGSSKQTQHVETNLNLQAGCHYSTRLSALNGAGLHAPYDTTGILVDPTPPQMRWVMAGAVVGETEEIHDGYVWQADQTSIQAHWRATDGESGIKAYWVAIGTEKYGSDVTDFVNMGPTRDGRLTGFQLQLTDHLTKAPVYYVTVKAENGAGDFSSPMTSTPIWIEEDDVIGYIMDGPDVDQYGSSNIAVDIDYQQDATTVTVQFTGFESKLYGLKSYQWAVGTGPRLEDVQPFTSAGIVLSQDESELVGGGRAGSGRAQAVLPLQHGWTYYVSVRAITGKQKVLEAVSDGFTIDTTPPKVTVTSLGVPSENTSESVSYGAETALYQQMADTLTASWLVADPESAIDFMQFAAGSYPEAGDIFPWTITNSTIKDLAVIPNGLIKLRPSGIANYLTIQAINVLGQAKNYIAGTMGVDTTAPTEGKLLCPPNHKAMNQIECNWEDFMDPESGIDHYLFGVGTEEGKTNKFSLTRIAGDASSFKAEGLIGGEFEHRKKYYGTLIAVNKVGLTTTVYSDAILIDATPPVPGMIVELSGIEYVDFSKLPVHTPQRATCTTDKECKRLDAVCQKSLTEVLVAWQHFSDPESGISSYEVGVGTTPGGVQVKAFFPVSIHQTSYLIDGLDLSEVAKVYVTLRGLNGVDMSSVAISSGIYISRVAAGLPPIGRLEVYDGDNMEQGDMDYQTSTTEISAWWDVSGEPCPLSQQRWRIERVDGVVYQDFTKVDAKKRSAVNVEMKMTDGETYFVVLQATNMLGYTFTLRSDGVTVEREPLIPGLVYDGEISGYDLKYQAPSDQLSANWDYFGQEKNAEPVETSGNPGVKAADLGRQQTVDFYEVAVGSDRRFPKTRDNVVPFTYVGSNKTVTFHNLQLTPITGVYYVTVRAHSKSYATAEVTSNGIHVGYSSGVTGGEVRVPAFSNTNSSLRVQWSGFHSDVDMLFYHVAIGNASVNANDSVPCRNLIGTRQLSEEEAAYFSVMLPANVGEDTIYDAKQLTLMHKERYRVYVIGTDQSSECRMLTAEFSVDITPPIEGQLRSGPFFGQNVSFASSDKYLEVWWQGYHDPESGLDSYELQLSRSPSCDEQDHDTLEVVEPWISLNSTHSHYKYMDLELVSNQPYFLHLQVTNQANTGIVTRSAPILLDESRPTAGVVKDGSDFKEEWSLHGNNTYLTATILHLANPVGPACPSRSVPFDNPQWMFVRTRGLWNMKKDWKLIYRPEQMSIDEDDALTITLERDLQDERMSTGSFYQYAEILNGGTYTARIKAATEHFAVTSVVLWDGPDGVVGDYDAPPPPADPVPGYLCDCCHQVPNTNSTVPDTNSTVPDTNSTVPSTKSTRKCDCDCSRQVRTMSPLQPINTTITMATVPAQPRQGSGQVIEDEIEGGDTYRGDGHDRQMPHSAYGMQLHPGNSSKPSNMVLWCRFKEDEYEARHEWLPLEFNPSEAWHTYSLTLGVTSMDGAIEDWKLQVHVDGKFFGELTGLPKLSPKAKLMFHLWNKDNFLPPINDPFYRPSAKAMFAEVRMPPERHVLCRYGGPFRGGTNSILAYEAGIGSSPGLTDVAPFRKVAEPCIPCQHSCDRYYCSKNCDKSELVPYTFTLDNLALPVTKAALDENGTAIIENGTVVMEPANYYVTVKAILASGVEAVASTNGVQLDVTPPIYILMFYMDVTRNQSKMPIKYQGSNDTIKVYWKFEDEESQIHSYSWAIGSSPGRTDLQDYIYVGKNQTATNSSLAGVIKSNHTYYVSIKARNSAGLETILHDGTGVTVLAIEPTVDGVNTSLPFGKPFTKPVYPKEVLQSSDPSEVGITFTTGDDPTISQYDYCVGSSRDKLDDVVGCFPVGRNVSGTITIKSGKVYSGDTPLVNISYYRPGDENGTVDHSLNRMNLEPGKLLYNSMKVCNGANMCSVMEAGTVLIMSDEERVTISDDGSDLQLQLTAAASPLDVTDSSVLRRKRATSDQSSFSVKTTGGMAKGGTLVAGVLSRQRLAQEYVSDATVGYKSYIVNPEETSQKTSRLLHKRLKQWLEPSVFVSPLGQIPLHGPMDVTASFSPRANWTDDMPRLLYWHHESSEWRDAAESCNPSHISHNWILGTVTTSVCDTSPETHNIDPQANITVVGTQGFFDQETQFALFSVAKGPVNHAPVLLSPVNYEMWEDGGTLEIALRGFDIEGDEIIFMLDDSLPSPRLGTVMLNPDFTLHYRPYPDVNGLDEIPIIISERRTDSIPVNSSKAVLKVDIWPVNKNPDIMLLQEGKDMLKDITEGNKTILVTIEENSGYNIAYRDFVALFVGYDIDIDDNITHLVSPPEHGILIHGVNTSEGIPPMNDITRLSLKHPPERYAWFSRSLTYRPNIKYWGMDEFRLLSQDRLGLYSKEAIIRVAVMRNPCANEGTCKGNETNANGNYTDPHCEDPNRAISFDGYVCKCSNPQKWGGPFCEERLDFCKSVPCLYPYECVNLENGGYKCRCPSSHPYCDTLQPWQIALIVVLAVLITAGVIIQIVWIKKCRQKNTKVEEIKLKNTTPVSPRAVILETKNPENPNTRTDWLRDDPLQYKVPLERRTYTSGQDSGPVHPSTQHTARGWSWKKLSSKVSPEETGGTILMTSRVKMWGKKPQHRVATKSDHTLEVEDLEL